MQTTTDNHPLPTSRHGIHTLITILISLGLLALLLHLAGWHTIRRTISGIRISWLLLSGPVYFATYCCRLIRFRILLPGSKPNNRRLLGIVCIHNFLNRILPMRSGEISFPLLAHRYTGIPLRESTTALLTARLLDLTAVLLFFAAAGLHLTHSRPDLDHRLLLPAAISGFLLLLLFFILLIGARRISSHMSVNKVPGRWIVPVLEAVSRLRLVRHLLPALAVSLLVWLFLYIYYGILLSGMGFRVPLAETIWGATVSVFTYILPVSSVGSFGTHEAGWTLGFAALGMSKDSAIATGFTVNVISTLYAGLFALPGLALRGSKPSDHRPV